MRKMYQYEKNNWFMFVSSDLPFTFSFSSAALSAGAVEYADCTSAEG